MFGGCLFASFGAVPGAASADTLTDREIEALIDGLQPDWTFSGGFSVGGGYKDNLLLSHAAPASSPFVRAGVEALLWRVPRGRFDYFGFVTAEYTRFTRTTTDNLGRKVSQEGEAFVGVEGRYRIPERLSLTLDLQGYYLDQVFDVSDASVARSIEALKVSGAKVVPALRWSPWRWVWAEAAGSADRQAFENGVNDGDIAEGSVRLGVAPTRWMDLSVGAIERRRNFDHRPRFAESGTLPGTLRIAEQERDVRLDTRFGERRKWSTRTRGLWREYRDNGLGFLDFDQYGAAQDVELSTDRWLFRVEGAYRHKEYPNQTVGIGIDPPRVIKEEVSARVRVERKLGRHWTLLLEYAHERARSNDVVTSYRANEGLLGARWNWEK